jgi:hypothetical protein
MISIDCLAFVFDCVGAHIPDFETFQGALKSYQGDKKVLCWATQILACVPFQLANIRGFYIVVVRAVANTTEVYGFESSPGVGEYYFFNFILFSSYLSYLLV